MDLLFWTCKRGISNTGVGKWNPPLPVCLVNVCASTMQAKGGTNCLCVCVSICVCLCGYRSLVDWIKPGSGWHECPQDRVLGYPILCMCGRGRERVGWSLLPIKHDVQMTLQCVCVCLPVYVQQNLPYHLDWFLSCSTGTYRVPDQ